MRKRFNEKARTVAYGILSELYGEQCMKCGYEGGDLEVDHIIPVAKGGTNHPTNLQLLCVDCNRDKRQVVWDYRPDTGQLVLNLLRQLDIEY